MSKRDKQLLAFIGQKQIEVARLLGLPQQTINQGVTRPSNYFRDEVLEKLRVALLENGKQENAERLVAFCANEAEREPESSLLKETETKRRISNNLYENFVADERGSLGIWALAGDEAIARIQAETPVIAEVLKRPSMKGRALVVLGSNAPLALLKNKLVDLVVSQWLTPLIASDDWEHQLRSDYLQATGKLIFMEQEWPPFTLEFLVLRRKVTAAGMVFTKKGFIPLESSIAERYMALLDARHKLAAVQSEDSKGIAAYWHSDMIPYLRCLALWESFLKNYGLITECHNVLRRIRSCFEDYNFYVNGRIDWIKASTYLGLTVNIPLSSNSEYWYEIMKLHEAVQKPDTHEIWRKVYDEDMQYILLRLA